MSLSIHNQFLGKTASIFFLQDFGSNNHQKTATSNQPEKVSMPEIVTRISAAYFIHLNAVLQQM